jgi:UDP-N-acetylglucosamine acyltransferase
VNAIGLRRRGFSEEVISRIQDAYRLIYVQNRNMSKALELVTDTLPDIPEVRNIVSFIRSSDKGIMKGMYDA